MTDKPRTKSAESQRSTRDKQRSRSSGHNDPPEDAVGIRDQCDPETAIKMQEKIATVIELVRIAKELRVEAIQGTENLNTPAERQLKKLIARKKKVYDQVKAARRENKHLRRHLSPLLRKPNEKDAYIEMMLNDRLKFNSAIEQISVKFRELASKFPDINFDSFTNQLIDSALK